MFQGTSRRIRDQISFLRDRHQPPFGDLLDAGMVMEVLEEEGVRYRERSFSPLVTLWTFLTQVLSLDGCCRKSRRDPSHHVSSSKQPVGRGLRGNHRANRAIGKIQQASSVWRLT